MRSSGPGGLRWRGTLASAPAPLLSLPTRALGTWPPEPFWLWGWSGCPLPGPVGRALKNLLGRFWAVGWWPCRRLPAGRGPGTQRRHGAAWSPSDVPTPLPYVVLVGSRHPINPGSRDLNSLWPSLVTGSKTNSSSCKLSITGKAGGGWPRAGEEGGLARSCYPPPRGAEGDVDPRLRGGWASAFCFPSPSAQP